MLTHKMTIAGLERHLPICRVNDDLYIGAFVIFGDAPLTVACAAELLKIAPEYDYLITAEAKGIPLAHETVYDKRVRCFCPLYNHRCRTASLSRRGGCRENEGEENSSG